MVAKTQNPFIHDPIFEEFTVPSLMDFMDEMRDNFKMLNEKVDTLERKYNTMTEERNVTRKAASKVSQLVSVNKSKQQRQMCKVIWW